MSRRILYLTAVALLLPGCVLVNQPLSDPEKAEPAKRLLGNWELEGASMISVVQASAEDKQRLLHKTKEAGSLCEIDSPAVKGNPKGLMHYRDADHDFWFFTTTIDKHSYWTVYLDEEGFADLSHEGAFEKWNKRDHRLYEIVLAVLEGDRLTLHHGGVEEVKKVMKAELIPPGKIGKDGWIEYFKTPPGWLAKYLDKNGPGTLYDGGRSMTWRRPEALEKEREAEAEARRKVQEEAARKAEQRKAEQRAVSYLGYAKKLAATGMVEKAKGRLREIVEKFPNTEAGKEAKQLLDKMGK